MVAEGSRPEPKPVLAYGIADSAYDADLAADAPEPEYAGFWLRFAALLIDVLIVLFVLLCLGLACSVVYSVTHHGRQLFEFVDFSIYLEAAGFLGAWPYYAKMESSDRMATFGKQLVGLRVTDLAGRKISQGRATGRYFAKFLSMMTYYVGFMMAGWTRKGQALHDKIAGTLVVKAGKA